MRTLFLIVAFLCALALACRPLDGRSIGVLDANVDESSLVELNQLNHPTPPTPTQAHRMQQRATPKKTTATAKKTTPKKTASTKKATDTKKATNTKKAATAKTAVATSAKVTAEMKSPSEAEFKKLFTAYKTKFKRKYKSATTEATAYKSFKTRYMKSHEKNERAYAKMAAKAKAKGKPAPKAVAIFNAEKSPLGDVEDAAFKRKYLGGRPPSASSSSHKKMLTELSKKPRSKTVAATAKSAAARFAELGLDEDNSSGIHMLMEIASELDQQQWPSPQPSQPLAPQPLTAPQSWPTTQPLAPQPVTGPQSWPTTQPSQPWKGGALPAVNSVPAPSGGDNKAKGRKGGDNKASGRKGGDNKASTRKGGDNKASGRKGGDDDNVSTNDISQQSLDADIQGATFKVGPVGFAFGNSNLRMLHDMSNRFPASTRNQGDCQSCWAVTASEHFQSILTSTLLFSAGSQNRLSAQQIIDCQISNVDLGCNGGTVTGAFDYIQLKGVSIASKYPYPLDGTQHACATPAADAKIFKAQRSLFLVPPCLGDVCAPNPMAEATLLDFWQNPPYRRATTGQTASIPVIAYVDSSNWQDYTGGIFPSSECSSAGGDLNHIVQIVGYGMDSTTGQAFWLVRNSWGSDWGEKGYIRLPYGENACGIFNYVIYLEAKEDIPMDANSVRVRNLQAMVNASPRVKALASMQALVNGGR